MAKGSKCRYPGKIPSKRRGELEDIVESLGLGLLEIGVTSGGHVYMEVRNGSEDVRRFFAPISPSDYRANLNFKSTLRKFSRGAVA